MIGTTATIVIDLAFLAAFLISIVIAKYSIATEFGRTRFIMSALFLYIVASLTNTYWRFALMTLPYTIPAGLIGILLGYLAGVRTERRKLMMQGAERYIERFARISKDEVATFTWWTFINFYSITAALILINFIGFTSVLMHSSKGLINATSVVGASLIGSIIPYLIHLWIFPKQGTLQNSDSEAEG